MNWNRKELHWKALGTPQTTQILLEGDIIVSDNKMDVAEVLSCNGHVQIADQRIMEERMSVSGELALHILYIAKGGEGRICTLESSLPIEDIIFVEGLHKDMEVVVTGNVVHLDCRIINDRKMGVKCIVSFVAEPMEMHIVEAVTGDTEGDLAFLEETITLDTYHHTTKDLFTIKEEIPVPNTLPAIGELLRTDAHLVEKEVRPLEGKVMLRASIMTSVLYGDDQGMVHHFVEKTPFQGYLEDGNMTVKSMVDAELSLVDLELMPMLDENGEARSISLSTGVKTNQQSLDLQEEMVVLDAYAPQMETTLQKETIVYPKRVGMGKNQFHLKENIHLEPEERPWMQLEAFFGELVLEESRAVEDGVEMEGVLFVELLYHSTEDGKLCTVERGIPFSQKMELKGVLPQDSIKCRGSLENLAIQSLSEREGEVQANILMEGVFRGEELVEVVVDVDCKPLLEHTEDGVGAIIYQTQAGDTLWSVAKKYGTTMERITSINALETKELSPNQKILIVKQRNHQMA
ncbi:DUF3794 and LysM peptidoglycan-binding domain-containing protein [Chakrabartyella piscis]|uniref:DUF3794 and LysM peptidoglycan-binding domain-containing protein n=1 Tax=Chakrabartyella piscis TaxID=2918914 RepID=UPI00295838E2|nr:SPOCS domain-containing protein [Chakrabartyella piscis]